MKQTIKTTLATMVFAVATSSLFTMTTSAAHADIIDIGPEVSTFTGATRGYFFTAPVDFYITALGLPTTASKDSFDVSVLRFNSSVPAYSAKTTDFDTLFLSRDNAGAGLLSTSIFVSAGDTIGLLGSRGVNSTNSYGSGNVKTEIAGNNVVLSRLMMQADLRSSDPSSVGVSSNGDSNIGRVLFEYSTSTPPVSAVPEPSTYAMMIGGLGLVGFMAARRRKQA